MTILTPAPVLPDRSDPATFADRADNFVAWMNTIANEINGGALGATFVNGTVSAPSVRGNTDTDTGLNFLGSDVLQLVTGGVQRIRVSSAEALIDHGLRVSITLAVSASNALDTLAAGNQIVRVTSANVATVNGPSGASGGVVEQQYFGVDNIAQVYSEVAGTSPRQWFRVWQASAWTAWRQIYNQASAVGTVSQSSSIPTGALIERGNNANGTFFRFAGGLQVCFGSGNTVSGQVTWTYPATFSSAPEVFVSPVSALDQRSATTGSIGSGSVVIYGWTTVGAAWDGQIRRVAVGVWH
jgi:hypothetical protein